MQAPINRQHDRRLFIKAGAALAASSIASRRTLAAEPVDTSPAEKVLIGIMGAGGRGAAIAKGMMAAENAEIAYVCDVDQRAAARVGEFVGKGQRRAPQAVADFRRILDDRSVDALICAAPIIGTRRQPFWDAARANMFMSKSLAATHRPRARWLLPPPANMIVLCKWDRSGGVGQR